MFEPTYTYHDRTFPGRHTAAFTLNLEQCCRDHGATLAFDFADISDSPRYTYRLGDCVWAIDYFTHRPSDYLIYMRQRLIITKGLMNPGRYTSMVWLYDDMYSGSRTRTEFGPYTNEVWSGWRMFDKYMDDWKASLMMIDGDI